MFGGGGGSATESRITLFNALNQCVCVCVYTEEVGRV